MHKSNLAERFVSLIHNNKTRPSIQLYKFSTELSSTSNRNRQRVAPFSTHWRRKTKASRHDTIATYFVGVEGVGAASWCGLHIQESGERLTRWSSYIWLAAALGKKKVYSDVFLCVCQTKAISTPDGSRCWIARRFHVYWVQTNWLSAHSMM